MIFSIFRDAGGIVISLRLTKATTKNKKANDHFQKENFHFDIDFSHIQRGTKKSNEM